MNIEICSDKNRNERLLAYLNRFYEPKVTAYEFMKCFFACLRRLEIEEVDRDLVTFLMQEKGKVENAVVLEEIRFRTNGINYYSDDIEDALFNLQNGGLLGKMNPSFGIIIIKYDESEIQKAINSINQEYSNIIDKIAQNYKKKYNL